MAAMVFKMPVEVLKTGIFSLIHSLKRCIIILYLAAWLALKGEGCTIPFSLLFIGPVTALN